MKRKSHNGVPNHRRMKNHRLRRTFALIKSPETKYVDRSVTYTKDATEAQFADPVLLNGVAQGDDFDQRIGRKTRLLSINFRASQEIQNSSTPFEGFNCMTRIIIFWDKEPNGTAPTIAQLMAADSIRGFPNLDNRKRFRIVKDWIMDIPMIEAETSSTGAPAQNGLGHTECFLKCIETKAIDWVTIYNGTGDDTVASINQGGLFITFASQTPAAPMYSAGVSSLFFRARLNYSDS